MADSSNSVQTLLPQLLRLFNNSMEGFDKFSEAITSSKETVSIDLFDENDQLRRVFIPSFGFIKSELERLDANIRNQAGVGTAQSTIRLSDGTFRKITTAKIDSEAKDLIELNTVENFNVRANHFFESFINPLMYVSFDITGQAPTNTERVMIARYILDLDTQAKIDFFDDNYKGNSSITYDTFLRDLLEQNIGFLLDEDTIDVPPRELAFTGNFSVLRISNVEVTEEINGVNVTEVRKVFKLDKLTYTDTRSGFTDTLSLKVNDFLVINSDPKDTRYKIINVDSSTNSVVLELVEGFREPSIGTNIFSFYAAQDETLEVDINIGFNERIVTFIKPIDPDSKIPAINWSPGVGFYSNELRLVGQDGTVNTLETYYRNEAVDFGNFIKSLSKDNIPPSSLGVTPTSPSLDAADFKVVQVNKQITSNKTIAEITQTQTEKISLKSELKELDNTIRKKRTSIQTKNYNNITERDADRAELTTLIEERNSKTELYSSLVQDIDSKKNDENLLKATPKFNIRGFFKIPDGIVVPETGEQKIVQFIIQYRYLTNEGDANPVEQIPFKDGNIKRTGSFSNWIQYKSTVRQRVFDDVLNKYVWEDENVEDGDVQNMNSIDIPIKKGERVEIRVKSVSEAGWPSNPIESDWSNTIIMKFPDNLDATDKVAQIMEENNRELVRVQLENSLEAQGFNDHIANGFVANEKFFPHPSTDIASGFLSADQTPITLFDKLVEITNKLQSFEEILKKAKGTLVVKVADENGNEILIKKNQMNKFFAGYYADLVADLSIKKGVIISKTFFLTLENIAATTLELISRIPGTNTLRVKSSEDPGTTSIIPTTYSYYSNFGTYDPTDTDYNNNKKYDLVPIVLANPENPDQEIAALPPYQSSQFKAQFIYARYIDVAGEDTFYSYEYPDISGEPSGNNVNVAIDGEYDYGRITQDTGTVPTDFVWGGTFNVTSGEALVSSDIEAADDETIEVHKNHPFLASPQAFAKAYENLTGITLTIPTSGIWSVLTEAKQLFRQSKFAKIEASSTLGKKQNIYLYDNGSQPGSDFATIAPFGRTIKTSFDVNDQFLLGKQSCGCYLFMASDIQDNLSVDGKTAISLREITLGSENAVRIPIIFQFRMTDYFGDGDTGIGAIGGDTTGAITNLVYSKQMGFDIIDSDNEPFSFDIEVTAKYKSDNLNIDKLPGRSLQIAIDDIRRTIGGLSPSIVETKIEAQTN